MHKNKTILAYLFIILGLVSTTINILSFDKFDVFYILKVIVSSMFLFMGLFISIRGFSKNK